MKTLVKRNALVVFGLVIALSMAALPSVQAQYQCHSLGAPLVTTGDISATDTGQTSRMFRDGRGTTCAFNRPQTTSAGTYLEDAYTFTNTTGATACVFVDLDATGCGVATNQISMAAYLGTYNPASILTNVIADPGLSTGGSFTNSMAFSVAAGATYIIVVHDVNAATTCPSYKFTRYVTNSCRQPGYDRQNDGSADLAIFRPSGALSNWYTAPIGGSTTTVQFGSTGDVPVTGNYTGDEGADVAVFRPSSGTWYTSTNPATNFGAKQWGVNGDVPVQGDYDRDGITDVAVFRPSDNNWYILRSATGTLLQFPLGASGDKPVAADYDGDGRTDIGIWHPANGLWTVLSSAGTNGNLINAQPLFGLPTDLPVPADYDGDGKADFAVFRPSEGAWYIFRSSLTTGQVLVVPFGANGDIPQPADYDGDGKVDEAVFRPSTGVWYIHRSTTGDIGIAYGQPGDIPTTRPNIIP